MSPHDLLTYYTVQEAKATRQMVALPEGVQKQSAEECLDYFRRMRMHYASVCAKAKP